jgi:plastocyanin
MSERVSPGRRDMTGEVRFRVPIVIVLPIVALVLIGLATFGFSRLLLALEGGAATTLALLMAANVLGACSFVALRPETARRRWAELLAVILYPILIGIAIVATGAFGEEEAADAPAAEAPAGGGGGAAGNTIVASGIAFQTEEITATAGEEVSGTLANEDSVDHNIAFFNSEDETSDPGNAFYTSETAGAQSEVEFSFAAPDEPGDYPFVCDFHPTTMTGTLVVEDGGGGGSKGDGTRGGGDD